MQCGFQWGSEACVEYSSILCEIDMFLDDKKDTALNSPWIFSFKWAASYNSLKYFSTVSTVIFS